MLGRQRHSVLLGSRSPQRRQIQGRGDQGLGERRTGVSVRTVVKGDSLKGVRVEPGYEVLGSVGRKERSGGQKVGMRGML